MTQMAYLFSDRGASSAQVGGKGYSLMKMTAGGFPVPAGFVLGLDFFDEWLEQLHADQALRLLKTDDDDVLKSKTAALQKAAGGLAFSDSQRSALDQAVAALGLPEGHLFSVRSSSPEEDMEGASFAGMYETYLGVTADTLQEHIRNVFVSCIDYRVAAYKRQKGFDFTSYSIAVVIMAQILSEVAGVAFSINPLDNCYDEVVINANFGVGESVVSGSAVPDQFIVDKVERTILSRKLGDKKSAVVVSPEGGVSEVSTEAGGTSTLSDDQILELADMAAKVEAYYEMPMDTEWAYANGQFYMLQARSVTTYIPLHPAFLTEPGEPKKLYLDLTLIEQGIQKPLSVMGADCFRIMTNAMGVSACGVSLAEKPGDFVYAAGGRAYVNLTMEMLLEGQQGTAKEYEGLDSYAARIIREADMTPYKGKASFKGAWKAAKAVFTGLYKSRDLVSGVMQGKKHPEDLRKKIDEQGARFMEEMDRLADQGVPLADFASRSMQRAAEFMVHVSIPSLIDAEAAKKDLRKLAGKGPNHEGLAGELDKIDRGLPYNVTIDMGRRIYELMTLAGGDGLDDAQRIIARIEKRDMPAEFLEKWDEFMRLYGFRGPREVDVRTPRYHDDPAIIIDQMQGYGALDPENAPSAVLARQVEDREKAYAALLEKVKDKKKLERLYNILVNLGGYREIHKYYLVYAGNKIRRRALAIAGEMVDGGRIDAVDDIFHLTPEEVQRAVDDPALDVRAMIAGNRTFMSLVENIEHFPPVIDSRGKILRPERKPAAEGELQGDPVSAGRVSGRVAVVNYVGEKDVAQGDILVAKAADPGWTPLFINAAGILLEVGGMLQHGSLIAREYGKPCIAGVEGLTSQLRDGDVVEMDGATGLIRRL